MKSQRVFRRFVSVFALGLFLGMGVLSCGGGDKPPPPPPPTPPVTYSQADLAGTWHLNKLDAGTGAKWDRGKIVVDSGGAMTFPDFESSKAGDTAPEGMVVSVHSTTGVVSIQSLDQFHGAMSTDKKIIIATIREPGAPSLLVMQKADANVTFSSADIANRSFVYHHVKAGAENDWEYGFGVSDNVGNVTLNSVYQPDPATGLPINVLPQPALMGTMSITSDGIVTLGIIPTMRGVMSSDKNNMVITETSGTGSYTLTIVQMTGGTFLQADMTGPWNMSVLAASTAIPAWQYGTASVTSSGAVTFPAFAQIGNAPPPTDVAVDLKSSGELLEPATPSTHGAMSLGKDLVVLTTTMNAQYKIYGLAVMVRSTQAIVQDAAAITAAFDTLENLYATEPPTVPELNNWFATYVADEFLMDGINKATMLESWKGSGEGPAVGMALSIAIDEPMHVTGTVYLKGYSIALQYSLGTEQGFLPTKVVFDGTRWRWYGNQQWTEVHIQPRAEKSVWPDGTTNYTTSFDLNISDGALYAYGKGVRSALISGPALTTAGVVMAHDGVSDFDIYPGSSHTYLLTDDNVISAIPNYAEYTFTLCQEEASVIAGNPSLCTALQTYTYSIVKRPLTSVEAAAASYPVLTQPATHLLSDLTGDWASGSITVNWTNPSPQMLVNWAGLVWDGGSVHNGNLAGMTSTTFTVSGSAPTTWATLYMGGVGGDGIIYSLIWGFAPPVIP